MSNLTDDYLLTMAEAAEELHTHRDHLCRRIGRAKIEAVGVRKVKGVGRVARLYRFGDLRTLWPQDVAGRQFAKPNLVGQTNYVECRECGKRLKGINRSHLQFHGLTVTEYKAKYGYPKRARLYAIDSRSLRQDTGQGVFSKLTGQEDERLVRMKRRHVSLRV